MSLITKNNCGVTTILPLGVQCSVVDATTPLTRDGRIYLNITGGTSPYNISWSNGKKSQTIRNLTVGSYTGTVVDFYGDYSATTVCTVDSNQIFVDYFVDCNNEFNLYLTGFTSSVDLGKIYKFISNNGCFIYSGKTLSADNTLTNDSILEGPFETCEECDPPYIPPYFPDTLCLHTEDPYTIYDFEFYGFVNERPAYTGTSTNALTYTIEWYSGSSISYWVVQGKNQLKNLSDTYNPLGGWKKEGTLENWTATSGSCPTIPELNFTVTVNDETCEGSCDGSVTVTAVGGTGGYGYSLDGTYFNVQPTFRNLCPGINKPIYVTDSSGNTKVGFFTIKPGPTRTQYTLSLETKQYYTTQNWGTQTIKKLDYIVKVSPPLPDGVTIDVPLILSIDTRMLQPGSASTVYTPTLFSGGTSISPASNVLTSTNIIKPVFYEYRYPYPTIDKKYSIAYPTIKLVKGLTVSGSLESNITKISSPPSSCCQPLEIENIGTVDHFYTWVNCTGGTENNVTNPSGGNFRVFPGQKVNLCACSVTPLAQSVNSLVIRAGKLPCSSAVVDAYMYASVGFNGASISNGCVSMVVQTPSPNQSNTQLYQPSYSGPAQ